jgi:hypothetical protein
MDQSSSHHGGQEAERKKGIQEEAEQDIATKDMTPSDLLP